MKRVILFLGILALATPFCTKEDPSGPGWIYDPTPFSVELPDFFPIMEVPAGNPTTIEGVRLGRMLYYDPILHKDSAQACASCHLQTLSFSTPGNILPHINLAWSSAFLWNGKIQGSLEDVMYFESAEFFKTDLTRLQNHPDYPKRFYEAFGKKEVTYENIAKALSQFFRIMVSYNSKYDSYIDPNQFVFLEDEELMGFDIFFSEKGDCFHCHGGILFTDNRFHNNGLEADPEPGLFEITGDPEDVGRFKTPTLRNIELTGPYMHDSRYETLGEVIDFYSEGLEQSPTVDPLMKNVFQGGVHLTPQEKGHLIAFLKTLTDTVYVQNEALSNPFQP